MQKIPAHAQNTSINMLSGHVVSDKGQPLDDVYLQNLRNQSHTHSDASGWFKLQSVQAGDSIRISRPGYHTQQWVVSASMLQNIPQTIRLSPSAFQLDEVVIAESVNHLSSVATVDMATNPVNSAQEMLRKVPGLFIGQHAGGGKAEQLFLRGFDLDHGTDINISVDGMPVNMVSHAHGQGYADLHFLIPELVEKIDFDKGPYHADQGNLATAAYVAFHTKARLDENSITLEAGKFNTFKGLGLFNLLNQPKQSAYIAAGYTQTDGPFEASQDFKRLNLMAKYTRNFAEQDRFSFSAMHFNSSWLASGQIPQRAVDQGLISRFGAIDANEGGQTSRSNFNLSYTHFLNDRSEWQTQAYYSRYTFELYSNFTFFLNDPINGDQIRQKEARDIYGLQSTLHKNYNLNSADFSYQLGAGLRADAVHNIELAHTLNRNLTLERQQYGDVGEMNAFAFLNTELDLGKFLINPALRLDYLNFRYSDHLQADQLGEAHKSSLSPKLNFLYHPKKNLQFFLKMGKGFHSNDTRVVLSPSSDAILPAAWGADLGFSWKPAPRLLLNAALWYLYLQQEFVYVGDEGVIEPSGRTARKGIDFGMRYQLNPWLFLTGDMSYARPRALDEPKGANYIPLAPPLTFAGGLSIKELGAFSGSILSRYMAPRAANEDDTIIAKGYFVSDAHINYRLNRWSIGLIGENIFNTAWNETQFATESRLANEIDPVEEIHFTPGTSFNIRAVLTFRF